MRIDTVSLYVFDDRTADNWRPFALSRPCGDLRFGDRLLRQRLERFAGQSATATLSRSWLGQFQEPGSVPVLDRNAAPVTGDRLFLCSRFVPADESRWEKRPGSGPSLLLVGDQIAGAWLPDGVDAPDAAWFSDPAGIPGLGEQQIDGSLLRNVWDLVSGNPERLARDLSALGTSSLPDGVHLLGSGPVSLGVDVGIEPGVLFDTRRGGVRLDDGVEVRAGARLTGPLHAGAGSRLLGGPFDAVSAGPRCYLRGEIEETVVLGYANKAHDGFLGHAYLGSWVNLGAMTTNSDLKNNYGPVRLGDRDGEIETGLVKLGCLIGDHVKTAIGTMLNTGTVVETGANLFGDSRPPKWVRPFAWGHSPGAPVYDQGAFIHTALHVMKRRQIEPDDRTRVWLAACWDESQRPEPS
jgi:UDP-N-acetylglucosamine diphosphorylase/glucosamine-1-phosphate N-acetyltransferase